LNGIVKPAAVIARAAVGALLSVSIDSMSRWLVGA